MSDSALPQDKDKLDLGVLVLVLLRGWMIILGCLVVAMAAAYGWSHYQPRLYAVHMVVMPSRPVEEPGGNARGAAATAAASFNLYLQSLTSRGLAERLAKNPAATDAIDPHPGGSGWSPSGAQVQRFLEQHLSVVHDTKAGPTAVLAMTVADPEGGVKFLALLNQAANDYVGQHIGSPDVKPDPKETQPPAVGPPAAKVFDGPYALDGAVSPRPRTALRNGAIGGLLIGIAIVLLLRVLFGYPRKAGQNPAK